MAVLTANVQRPVRIPPGGLFTHEVPLAGYTNFGAGTIAHAVYKGSIVVCDVSDTDGYGRAAPLSSSVNAASGDLFLGVAAEYVSVTSADTADGSKKVLVYRNGVWGFPKGSVAQTDIGAAAYASDDQTITTTSTNNFFVGDIVEVDATYVWVDISRAFNRATSTA
jgi:predicted RecA/RadA family phage recombinase